MNTALFVGSATGLVTSLLWWLAGYKLVSVKHITSNFGDLSSAWDAGVRVAGIAILAVAAALLFFDSAVVRNWTFFTSWIAFSFVGISAYYIVRYQLGIGRQ